MGLDSDVWVQIVLAGFDDGDDKVGAKVELFEEARVAGGFEAEELKGSSGVEVAESVGEEREDVGVVWWWLLVVGSCVWWLLIVFDEL